MLQISLSSIVKLLTLARHYDLSINKGTYSCFDKCLEPTQQHREVICFLQDSLF